ncbi:YiiX/YebB-like N1pC/P60 family cysteine hydrolase [Phaeocystidibacter luteus]|uniref:Permuted papain-like amidase YaeF/Yiix C92 family enzyme n=1 Tax=Phaeocystidibacter luteus TaxID=911197 RepID=A0A6N6RJQ1_9FLAO|nr:YiiX/YebB-like N1pC/P60 family cysteine hydrolase [Phaeocystidibacter luteus]KAB2807712.1 hypothetical protein F8C67_11770 [Phaeocystidibacter luteus]
MKASIISLLTIALLAQACREPASDYGHLREGDLLFQDLDCGPMCDAIETVTEGVDGKDFSHCAMVVERNDSLFAIEAIGSGVQLTPIEKFYRRSGDTLEVKNITVGRVKAEYTYLIPQAMRFATQQVGQPYDDPFLLNNGRWYCSELLYESFKSANGGEDFFELFPMTFKDPGTNEFFPAWTDYYAELGDSIPEGEPGLNPGSISRSERIEIIE